jgi:ABC-type oligopeptide transport system substrate-binding subunit
MTLVRNPGYHGRFGGNVQRVELIPLLRPDWLALLARYEADELDVLPIRYFPLAELNRARQRHSGEYVSAPMPVTWYIVFVVSKAPFDDVRVRRAFVLAHDRDARRDDVTAGALFPANGGLVPPGMPGHSPGIGLPYDPDRARQLLAEAGYPGGRGFPVVELLIWPGTEDSFQNLQARWRENLGVELTWESIDLTMFPERLKAEPPHMVFQGWGADYPDPDNCLRVGFPRPWSGWRNKVYHTLVEDARRVMDQRTRMRLYREADRLLMEEAAVLPFTYGRQDLLVKPWVKAPVSAAGDLIWKDVIIEPH